MNAISRFIRLRCEDFIVCFLWGRIPATIWSQKHSYSFGVAYHIPWHNVASKSTDKLDPSTPAFHSRPHTITRQREGSSVDKKKQSNRNFTPIDHVNVNKFMNVEGRKEKSNNSNPDLRTRACDAMCGGKQKSINHRKVFFFVLSPQLATRLISSQVIT